MPYDRPETPSADELKTYYKGGTVLGRDYKGLAKAYTEFVNHFKAAAEARGATWKPEQAEKNARAAWEMSLQEPDKADLWQAWVKNDKQANDEHGKDTPGKSSGKMATKANLDATYEQAGGDPEKMRQILRDAGLRF